MSTELVLICGTLSGFVINFTFSALYARRMRKHMRK